MINHSLGCFLRIRTIKVSATRTEEILHVSVLINLRSTTIIFSGHSENFLSTAILYASLFTAIVWGVKIRDPPHLTRFVAKVLSVSLLSTDVIFRRGPGGLATALALGSLGDTFLASGSGEAAFLGTLLSFLLGHIVYILFFKQLRESIAIPYSNRTRLYFATASAVYACVIIPIILKHIKARLRLPCIAYCSALIIIANYVFVLLRRIALGGVCFVVSDSILALYRFVLNLASPYQF